MDKRPTVGRYLRKAGQWDLFLPGSPRYTSLTMLFQLVELSSPESDGGRWDEGLRPGIW